MAERYLTNDSGVHCRLLELRDHGRQADGEIVSWGLNSRLDNLQAGRSSTAGCAPFRKRSARRRALARLYRERLGNLEELVLPPGPDSGPDHFDVYQNYEIEAPRRAALRAFLEARGIGTLLPWGGKAVHQWPAAGFPAAPPLYRTTLREAAAVASEPFAFR